MTFTALRDRGVPCKLVIKAHLTIHDSNKDLDSPYCRELFAEPAGVETDLLGTSIQRHYRISDVAYDRQNGLPYVLALFTDGARLVIYVWRVETP